MESEENLLLRQSRLEAKLPDDKPYNPLEKISIAESIQKALLDRAPVPMAELKPFEGAGIYAIYYVGPLAMYSLLVKASRKSDHGIPIYVGKAVPKGGRRGGDLNAPPGKVLYQRLKEHAESIAQTNLRLEDFLCRHLTVDDVFIALGEALLIQTYSPIWNRTLDGFGNHDPGGRRANQFRSPWDVVHPGRPWAEKLGQNPKSAEELKASVENALAISLGSKGR